MKLTVVEWYSQGKTVVLGEKFVSVPKSNVNWPEIEPGPCWDVGDYQPELKKMTWKDIFQRSWNAATRIPWSLNLEAGFFETSEINNLLLSITTQNSRIIIVEAVETSNLVTEFRLLANQFLQPFPTLTFRSKSSTMQVTVFVALLIFSVGFQQRCCFFACVLNYRILAFLVNTVLEPFTAIPYFALLLLLRTCSADQ